MSENRQSGITGNTSDRRMFGPGALYKDYISEASPGTLLGATTGGSTFDTGREILNTPVDGALGPVKGFDRRINVVPMMVVNMLESTKDNLKLAIAGANEAATPKYVDVGLLSGDWENVGVGDGATAEYQLKYGSGGGSGGLIVADTLLLYEEDPEGADVGPVLLVLTTDYAINVTTGAITLVANLDANHVLVARYTANTDDAKTHDTITGGDIEDGDYLTNIALVAEIAGKTSGCVYIVKNAIVVSGLVESFVDKEQVIFPITFEGRFAVDALTTEPWEVQFPTD